VKEELSAEGVIFKESLPVGCMVEVPSAAIISDLLAKECDFLSIGTNDLVQYSLAVDRTDHAMSHHYTPTHPSVLRLIRLVAEEAGALGVPVSICGEIAADPKYTALLLGLGINELSVSLRFLPMIKQTVRQTSILEAYALAEKALSLGTSEEIDELLLMSHKTL
jgi:phosphotransferase system enzyme I (PtsI)